MNTITDIYTMHTITSGMSTLQGGTNPPCSTINPTSVCWRTTQSATREVPGCYVSVHAFLNAGNDNREWEAYLAYKGTIPWRHSIPLSSVVSYLKWRGPAL